MNEFHDNHGNHYQYQTDPKEDILSYITTDRFLSSTLNNNNNTAANTQDTAGKNFQENFQALAFAMKSDLTNNNFCWNAYDSIKMTTTLCDWNQNTMNDKQKKGKQSNTPNWENKSRLVVLKNETSITFRRWWWWIDVNNDNYQKRWKKTWLSHCSNTSYYNILIMSNTNYKFQKQS